MRSVNAPGEPDATLDFEAFFKISTIEIKDKIALLLVCLALLFVSYFCAASVMPCYFHRIFPFY